MMVHPGSTGSCWRWEEVDYSGPFRSGGPYTGGTATHGGGYGGSGSSDGTIRQALDLKVDMVMLELVVVEEVEEAGTPDDVQHFKIPLVVVMVDLVLFLLLIPPDK